MEEGEIKGPKWPFEKGCLHQGLSRVQYLGRLAQMLDQLQRQAALLSSANISSWLKMTDLTGSVLT
jgi:hypothetical protein